jgi:glycosidase
MDFVPNHTSNKHIWFQESANNTNYTDYYIWKDAKNHYEVMNNSSVQPIVPNNWVIFRLFIINYKIMMNGRF